MIKVSVISPTSHQEFDDVRSIVAATVGGQVKILPGHGNLVSSLEIGELKLETSEDKKVSVAVNEGVLRFVDNTATVLTSDMAMPQELAEKEIDEAIERAQKKLSAQLLPAELIQIEKEIKYQKLKRNLLDSLG